MSPKGLGLPENVTKFLVFNDNPKYLRYVFGQYGMFVESITSIADKSAHGQFQRPAIVMVYYKDESQIRLLKEVEERLQARRLFKTVWKKPKSKDKIDAFLMNCAKNLLNLVKGKILRIYCKDDHKLQQRAYDIFMKVNEDDKLGCTFDYDEYDVLFWIKEYVATSKGRHAIAVSTSPIGKLETNKVRVPIEDKHWFVTSVEGLEKLPSMTESMTSEVEVKQLGVV